MYLMCGLAAKISILNAIVSLLLSKSFIFSKVTDDTCNAHCLERSIY